MKQMITRLFMTIFVLGCVLGGSIGIVYAGDEVAGEKVFRKCKACHVVDKEQHKTGPHLVNIFGRKAGSLESFKRYSKAIKTSDIIWDDTTIDAYIAAPKAYIKGTKMAFAGLKKQTDRDDVIAYMKKFSKE